MYSGGNLRLYITPVKFYVSYYPNFNALAIQCVTAVPYYHCTTVLYESVLHYHFTLLKCIQLLAFSIDGLSIALLTALIASYSPENSLYYTLYHNRIKPPKIAFKRVTSLCPFYRIKNLTYTLGCFLPLRLLYSLYAPFTSYNAYVGMSLH